MAKSGQDKNNPSSTFYWKDYENDEGLRISSLAAQGLWMRLLCIAAKSEPFGYISVNGYPLDATGTARLAGVTEGEAAALLDELERNGVFSRDRKGRMFSRRMVKEAETRAKNQKNGRLGGNPALSASNGKQKEKTQSVNPPDKPEVKGQDKAPLPISPSLSDTSYLQEEKSSSSAQARLSILEEVMLAVGVDPKAPPKFWRGSAASTHVLGWQVAFGLTDDEVVEAARLSQDGHSEPPDGPKALDRFMAGYAKAKASAEAAGKPSPAAKPKAAPKPPASPEDRLAFYAEMVNSDKYIPPSMIGNTMRDALLHSGLVTKERLRDKGIYA